MLTNAQTAALHHEAATNSEFRKAKGQFFTPVVVAQFMANLFRSIPCESRLLDAGAGVGMLTAAVCERIAREESGHSLHADLFETDSDSIPHLCHVLKMCQTALNERGHKFSYTIIDDNFALREVGSSTPLFRTGGDLTQYDLAIMNPPYFKIGANTAYAKMALRLGASQPNIYSLFMAAAIERLLPNGEIVAITPRSYCNGRYFREFRNWLFQRVSLEQVHSFASRTDTFREAKVLQESIITLFRKTSEAAESVVITRSYGRDLSSVETQVLTRNRVIDNSCQDNLICIPETPEDAAVMEITENWNGRFSDTGLRISTGPVVMFRTRRFHVDKLNGIATVPLFSAHHVRHTGLFWPNPKPKWPEAFAAGQDAAKHLVPRGNYLLLKRFSAKEERRRLTASALFAADGSYDYLAFENHINYVAHKERSLSENELSGLEALFNSAILDRYFRTFSGNTQVNATEIRTMKFPDLETISSIGSVIRERDTTSCSGKETIVLDVLGISGSTRSYLEGLFS